jgi:hypothetical protein
MKLRTCTLMVGLLLVQLLNACTQTAPATSNPALSSVILPGTEVRQLISSETGREYDINIRLPEQYTQSK